MKQKSELFFVQIKTGEIIKDGAAFIGGCGLYAVSVNMFTAPNHIAPGGLTGVATVLNHLFHLPIGAMIIVLNIPLFWMGGRRIGWPFLIKTVIATTMMSVLIDFFALLLPAYTEDKLLATLYGGVFAGAGLAMILLRGGTTGGTDIVARLLYRKFPHMPMGRIMLMTDAVVIAFAAVVFQSFESALYAMIVIFASSLLIDNLLYGAERGKLMFIMSEKHESIMHDIIYDLGRGATLLEAEGAYTKKKNNVLLCAIRRQEVSKLHAIIQKKDPDAFIVVTEAGEILGEGFKKRGR